MASPAELGWVVRSQDVGRLRGREVVVGDVTVVVRETKPAKPKGNNIRIQYCINEESDECFLVPVQDNSGQRILAVLIIEAFERRRLLGGRTPWDYSAKLEEKIKEVVCAQRQYIEARVHGEEVEKEGAKRVPASKLRKWKAEQTKIRCSRSKKGKHSACVDCSCPGVRQPNRSLLVGAPSGPRSPISEGRKDCELQAGTGGTEGMEAVQLQASRHLLPKTSSNFGVLQEELDLGYASVSLRTSPIVPYIDKYPTIPRSTVLSARPLSINDG
ncbi:hypothetical protein B0T20DRAFT_397186 [Sordaria brevicollis]|uniref:Uncharacterized protein n=1 Tax=Sordaria brevicollis TaxID=83679 RepID=A0AAE0NW83_SORBR|nr:hypothetical protein B0T20DRAFT_397186 [Sordaria brevicollis]